VASPFVLGPIVIAGFVAVVLAFHDHR